MIAESFLVNFRSSAIFILFLHYNLVILWIYTVFAHIPEELFDFLRFFFCAKIEFLFERCEFFVKNVIFAHKLCMWFSRETKTLISGEKMDFSHKKCRFHLQYVIFTQTKRRFPPKQILNSQIFPEKCRKLSIFLFYLKLSLVLEKENNPQIIFF